MLKFMCMYVVCTKKMTFHDLDSLKSSLSTPINYLHTHEHGLVTGYDIFLTCKL